MCGIFGFIGDIIDEVDTNKVIKTMKHRGPDDDGVFNDGTVLLVHLRLSILDLSSNGHQPMLASDEQTIICFNGEIYNHLDLRKELTEKHDIRFKSDSDTETLLYGYKVWGKSLLNKLNGIFAFIIYDKIAGKVLVVRDHFGIKPLYIYQNEGVISFSSEIKAFLDLPGFDFTLKPEVFVNYVNYLWSPGTSTPFQHVTKLAAGSYLEYDLSKKNTEFSTYYDIPFDGKYLGHTEEELIDEVDRRLQLAVKRQLLSDVPVAFFLSGGLDSSILVAMATKFLNSKATAYTIDTSQLSKTEGFSDDLYYARLVAEHLNVDLKVVEADISITEDFDKMIYHLDEPQADAAPLNVLNICRAAKADGFKVMIGGTAGDDVFSGYRRHQAVSLEKYFSITPLPVRRVLKMLSRKINSSSTPIRRIKKIFNEIDLPIADRLANYFNWLPFDSLRKLFRSDVFKGYSPNSYLHKLLLNIPMEKSWLNKMLYWEMKTFLVDHNLNYTDKMSMAEGVEVRVPFLDVELVDFACKINPNLKMKGKEAKYILKKVAERYLPHDVIYRSKAGFGAPVRTWIVNDLSERVNKELSEKRIEETRIFNYQSVAELIADNKTGKVDASYSIWSMLAIQSWIKTFTKNK